MMSSKLSDCFHFFSIKYGSSIHQHLKEYKFCNFVLPNKIEKKNENPKKVTNPIKTQLNQKHIELRLNQSYSYFNIN